VFTLDTAARTAVQNKQPGVVGIPTTPAQLATPSIYRGIAKTTEIQALRNTFGLGFDYKANQDLTLNFGLTNTSKSGHQPFGMSFAFNNANELSMPLDNNTMDFTVGLEWAKKSGMFRAAFDHSAFSNSLNAIEWDSPLRVTDYNNGLAPLLGPYDPSGYSNGNGPAKGRISSFPDNTMSMVSFMGLYKFGRHTTLNGTMQFTDQTQNDDLIPWTTNSVINTPQVWASFPELASLPRGTAEAKVSGVNGLVNFNTRPAPKLGFNAKYRHNAHNSMSRPFEAVEYVRFDAVPEETGGTAEGHSIVRDTFDATASYALMPMTTLRVGYTYDNFARTGRAHNDMRDNAFKVTLDTTGNQYVTLRFGYELTARTGHGFSESAIEEGGAQPDLRFYDEADRDRNRFNVLATFIANDKMDVTGSVGYIKDTYNGPGHEFGLLDNKNTTYNIGVNVLPTSELAFGMNYGRDTMNAFQESRNANPPPDAQFNDPNRNWTMTNDEAVNNFDLYLDYKTKKFDVHFGYTLSDSDNAFVFGGPRVDPAVTGSLAATKDANGVVTFEQLPTVTNKWQLYGFDVKVPFSPKMAIGAGYWYEKFDVSDFATTNLPGTDQPRIDNLGAITTGYGNRPYKGGTGTVRLIYTF
jgi:MtrB/PioB family decaheme-associated outer membrane protein